MEKAWFMAQMRYSPNRKTNGIYRLDYRPNGKAMVL